MQGIEEASLRPVRRGVGKSAHREREEREGGPVAIAAVIAFFHVMPANAESERERSERARAATRDISSWR